MHTSEAPYRQYVDWHPQAHVRFLDVKPGGLLVSNDHGGDAVDAAHDAHLTLVGVMDEPRRAVDLREGDLDGYLAGSVAIRWPEIARDG